jgi:hypothetical protein
LGRSELFGLAGLYCEEAAHAKQTADSFPVVHFGGGHAKCRRNRQFLLRETIDGGQMDSLSMACPEAAFWGKE